MAALVFAICTLLVAAAIPGISLGDLELDYYRDSCPQAEHLVKRIALKHFKNDPSLPAGLLRMHFHDCFIRGCDASILLDSQGDNVAEKEAPPNLTLRGFELIDKIKFELEKQCEGIVSCADILALATREGAAFAGAGAGAYALPTGRRDGLVSKISEFQIPGPSLPVSEAVKAFETINLDMDDFVTLIGAHSIGFGHCGFFVERLYNFRGSGKADPNMDPRMLKYLKKKCPQSTLANGTDPIVFMTPTSRSPFNLNINFYKAVLNKRALLHLDQDMAFTHSTYRIIRNYIERPDVFMEKFARAMIKLGGVNVLTGERGEIRQNCRRVNRPADNQ